MDNQYYVIGTRELHISTIIPDDMYFTKPVEELGIFPTAEYAMNAIMNGVYNESNYPVLAIVHIHDNSEYRETNDHTTIPTNTLREIYTRHCDHMYHRGQVDFKDGEFSVPAKA